MALRNLFQSAGNFVDVVGTKLGVPEFGISEALSPRGVTTNTGSTPQSQAYGFRPYSQWVDVGKVPDVNASGLNFTVNNQPAPTQSQSGSFSSSPTPAPQTNQALQNLTESQARGVDQTKAAEEARRAQFLQQQTEQINSAFAPILNELDRRLGILPQVRTEQERSVANIAATEAGGVDEALQLGLGGLDQVRTSAEERAGLQRGQVERQSVQNIKELESDLNRAAESGLRRLGAAGDSSAAHQVSESIYRSGLREKGKQLGIRDELFNNINLNLNTIIGEVEQKVVQVKQLASQQKTSIESWKQRQLAEIASAIRQSEDQLRGMMANATGEQRQMVAGLQQQVFADAESRLRQLDDEVRGFRTAIDQWQVQRMAEMDDYRSQLAMSASYSARDAVPVDLQQQIIDDGMGNKYQLIFNKQTGQSELVPLNLGALAPPEEEEEQGFLRSLWSKIY